MRGPRLLLVLLLLTALTLLTLDVRSGTGGPLRGAADRALGPAQRAVGGAVRNLAGVFDGDSRDEQRLATENDRLRAELLRTEDLQRRVDELDRLLGLRDAGTYPMVPARVAAIGSAFGFASTITLDAGSRDGIAVGQTVVSGRGLLGRTIRVAPFTSTVLLLTDPGFTAGARLTRAGTIGLATGNGKSLVFELVEGGRIAAGDALLTTGSDTFVPGVPIGRVTSVAEDTGALLRTAVVEPFVDVSSLDLVGVVTEPPRGTPRVPLEPSPR